MFRPEGERKPTMLTFLKSSPPPSTREANRGSSSLEQSTERLARNLDKLEISNGAHRYNAATHQWINSGLIAERMVKS
jgi:hypothetical protein